MRPPFLLNYLLVDKRNYIFLALIAQFFVPLVILISAIRLPDWDYFLYIKLPWIDPLRQLCEIYLRFCSLPVSIILFRKLAKEKNEVSTFQSIVSMSIIMLAIAFTIFLNLRIIPGVGHKIGG